MSFEEWMKEIDQLLIAKVGLGTSDLADAPYYDNWESGLEPIEMCAIVLVEWNDMDPNFAAELGFVL
jgi:hypothetical protein